MTLARVEPWDPLRDGPLSEAALQHKIEALGFEVTARVYPAGSAESPTVHGKVCVTGVVRGMVKLTVDGHSTFLSAGDLAFITPGARRRLEPAGPGTALCLEAFSLEEDA